MGLVTDEPEVSKALRNPVNRSHLLTTARFSSHATRRAQPYFGAKSFLQGNELPSRCVTSGGDVSENSLQDILWTGRLSEREPGELLHQARHDRLEWVSKQIVRSWMEAQGIYDF
ncbi:hypothetical protein E4U54_003010 [Claviceps lovelessii]|nr:hypothetical protein E4U54_003010 [Claviceps lovelessii]